MNASLQQNSVQAIGSPESQDNDPEAVSRKDASWTPIASSDKILDWGVFPREKPTVSFPASAYEPKPNLFSCSRWKLLQTIKTNDLGNGAQILTAMTNMTRKAIPIVTTYARTERYLRY